MLAATAGLLAAAALAPQLEVRVEAEGGWALPHREVTVEVVRRPAGGGESRSHRLQIDVGSSRAVAVEIGELVQVRVASAGTWAPERAVRVTETGATAVLALRPTRALSLRAAGDGGERLEEVRVMFSSPPPSPGKDATPILAGEVWGRVEEGERVVLDLPAGRWDLRVSALDRAPVYLWGVDLSAAVPRDLGRLVLRRAASVSGFVLGPGGVPLAERPLVTLDPAISDIVVEAADEQRLRYRRRQARVDERGFFQIVGVEAGEWRVEASCPGYLSAAVSPVSVVAGAESRLAEPLRLRKPVPVRVTVSPPRDPWGGELTVRLFRPRGDSAARVEEQVGGGMVDEDGVWQGELGEGSLRLEVRSAAGVWWDGEVEVAPPDAAIQVMLALVEVEGTVRRGRQSMQARVCFEAERTQQRVCSAADAEGRFTTYLPGPGRWGVVVERERGRIFWRVVEVASKDRTRIAVELPDTRLAGSVTLESGDGLPGATVRASAMNNPDEGSRDFHAVSELDGRFALEGLPEGTWHLVAATAVGPSDGAVVTVAAGRNTEEVHLVVRSRLTVRGRVQAGGSPVPGAQVTLSPQCFSSGATVAVAAHGTTDVGGRFEVLVGAPCGRVSLAVFALGHAAACRRVAVGGGEELAVSLESRGGTLVLLGSEVGWERRHVLVHQGGTLPVAALVPWAARHGGGAQGVELRIPALESGLWGLCPGSLVPLLETLPEHSTALPEGCASTVLPPGGTAPLAVP